MDYFVTTEFMTELGLDLREQTAFAIIYSFSQDNEGCWYGSIATMSKWLGNCTTPTTISVLKRLVSKGLIRKREIIEHNVRRCEYSTSKKIIEGYLKNLSGGTKIFIDNNDTKVSKSYKKENNNAAPSFDFLSALIELGVSEQTASDWMKVRKAARAVDTETAFRRIEAEIEKTGADAEDCIALAVAKNWRGFEAAWYKNATTSHPRCAAPSLHDLDPVTAMGIQAGIIEPYDYER